MNSSKKNNNQTISIVIPMHNEEKNVQPLISSVINVVDKIIINYEVIIVDDGSSDRTWDEILSVASINKKIKSLRLTRNFGHQHALYAGYSFATGNAIVSMDGDLQHPPEIIEIMYNEWVSGNKIVNTKRISKEQSSFFKHYTSKYFYKIFSSLADVKIDEGTSDFRLIDKDVLLSIMKFKDADLFLRGMVNWTGFRTSIVPYNVNDRLHGNTKYNLRKMLSFAAKAIASFSSKPLKIGVYIGLVTSFFAFIEIFYVIYEVYLGRTVSGWASTVGLISLLFGILFILLGIIGSYLARIHACLQNRPRFVIDEIINFS